MSYKIRLIFALVVLSLSILGVLGVVYFVPILNIQLAPLLARVFADFSVVALILLISALLLTLFFGRFYCSSLCPLGILQECTGFIATLRHKAGGMKKNLPFKYFIMAVVFGALAGGTAILLKYFEPYTFFASAFTLSLLGAVAVILILALTLFKGRFFCTNLCPAGALLGIISKFSINKIYVEKDKCNACGICEKNCPAGSINFKEVDNETCIKCLKCLNVCPKGALKYGPVPLKFSPKRRDFIVAASAVAFFGVFYKIGVNIKNKTSQELKDVILPPGAISEARFINKCTNCNLCAVNCPEKIIKRANAEFAAVHLDYSKGFCKFECNKCCQVCPTGAIKRLSLDEKQKMRVASAVVKNNCTNCKECQNTCPTKAIETINGKSRVDVEKCIGCGICKNTCKNSNIKIYAALEQKLLS